MNQTSSNVAAFTLAMLDEAAPGMRVNGQEAFAFRVDPDGMSIVLSLEVSRADGDWQRNLVITLDSGDRGHEVEARIADDEQMTVARIGEALVADAQLADVTLAFARAGLARLAIEVAPAVVA